MLWVVDTGMPKRVAEFTQRLEPMSAHSMASASVSD